MATINRPYPIIQLADVSFTYNGIPVLEDVSFSIEEKQLVYVVGPNGGGKTTLLKLIMGLIDPRTGRVSVFGQWPDAVRTRIGYAPQHMQFDPHFPVTVTDVVLMGRTNIGRRVRFTRDDRTAAHAALEKLGIADLAKRSFSELSGGQRQRVLIARSLCNDPELLLLDEPTANVDAHTEDKLLDTITQLCEQMTILMVSHDLGFVSDQVRSVICVNRQVHLHPTGAITSDAIRQLYDKDMRIIRHDLTQ